MLWFGLGPNAKWQKTRAPKIMILHISKKYGYKMVVDKGSQNDQLGKGITPEEKEGDPPKFRLSKVL